MKFLCKYCIEFAFAVNENLARLTEITKSNYYFF